MLRDQYRLMVEAHPDGNACPMCNDLYGVTLNIADVRHPWFGKAFRCPCQEGKPKVERVPTVFAETKIPEDLRWRTFDAWRELPVEVREAKKKGYRLARILARDGYIESKSGIVKQWLILQGGTGHGKSSLAAAVILHFHEQGRRVLWIDVADLLEMVQNTYGKRAGATRKDITDAAGMIDVLVLDDMGDMESDVKTSDDKRGILYAIIRERHLAKKTTIITTNLSQDQFRKQYGARITRRVRERGVWVEVPAPDISQYGEE